ncbi:hypothetical protein B0H16DRAFT_1786143 [Mycena metata]|uniref:Uncharacterized protein n=1 Tax=Mycena metata TaxID=1033252 RepID=A0AAD7MNM7_9AGAR|nr:hypothetical protein B0H16DRAFT_1786143 [Mycena metata]
MPTRTVYFRPRPPIGMLGSEYIPQGPDGRFFHQDFEHVPSDATERREFQCSATLESYLVEFYRDIRPKFQFPSLEGSPDLCGLLASHKSDDEIKLGLNIWAFRMRVTKAMLAWMGALPADAVARVQLGDGVGPSDDEILVMGLLNAAMASMRDDLIELKVWASIFEEINDYFGEFQMLLASSVDAD